MRAHRGVRWGANYTPRRGWLHHWLDFDLGAVREDFAALAELGLDHVRVFCLWPVFQPNRGLIRPQAIEQLVDLVDTAAEVGLGVAVDGIQGHLSSFDFLPSWVQTWHQRNLFTDPHVIAAQATLLGAIAAALSEHPAFLGIGLGNETNQFAHPDHPTPTVVTSEQIDAWLERLLGAVESRMPNGLHQHSFDDRVWFDDRSPITPAHATRFGDVTTVHSWVFTGVAGHYGSDHPAVEQFARYLVELASAWAGDPARLVWLQEVGAPAPSIPAEQAADFLEGTVRHVAAAPNLWGITWWCSHDVDRSLLDFPELEYTLGLFTASGERKPAGERLATLTTELADQPPELREGRVAVVVDGAGHEDHRRRSTRPGSDVFEAWLQLAVEGTHPAIVLAERAEEPDYLSDRGIEKLLDPSDITG